MEIVINMINSKEQVRDMWRESLLEMGQKKMLMKFMKNADQKKTAKGNLRNTKGLRKNLIFFGS